MKKLAYAALAAFMVVVFVGCSDISSKSNRNVVTYTSTPEVYAHVRLGYNDGILGPITVTEGSIKVDNKKSPVYLITLSGTETGTSSELMNQATNWLVDLQSGFCLDNDYLAAVVDVISENIPQGANIVLSGHSLGGMIAQQVAAETSIKDNYNVMYTLTFGSPLLAAGSREGKTYRLGDTSDVVPYLSGSLFNNTLWAILGLNRENGNYGLDFLKAHSESYSRDDLWGKYDAVGKKNGNAKISIDMDTLTYYHAPTAWALGSD
ncbi:MAG: hypothetical protein K5839_04940 [Treponemataceae bacterium]|nr:hypothetical protein [Treponemataceae bacterium]